MPRDLSGCGRYPPQPRYHPFAFYSAVRLGDPEVLERIMKADPYFITQDNGAGAPLHFAVTYKRLDMAHHLLNNGAHVNQRDAAKGFTPLHRAAYLAHTEGGGAYLELYELLLSHGGDPSVLSEDYDTYLDPGRKTPRQVASQDPQVQAALAALEYKYHDVTKAPVPHPDIGDWWALYDYGPEVVGSWPADYKHPYPELAMRAKRDSLRRGKRDDRRAKRDQYYSLIEQGMEPDAALARVMGGLTTAGAPGGVDGVGTSITAHPFAQHVQGLAVGSSSSSTTSSVGPGAASSSAGGGDVALLFPGQGSQAVGMLSEASSLPSVQAMLHKANELLGYDLLEVCMKGPKEKLDDTAVCQPAMFVAGLAAAELLAHRESQQQQQGGSASAAAAAVLPRVGAVAGLSLGEYCALVWAGAMSFEEGLKVVKERGEAMAEAARQPGQEAHGMLSVVGLRDDVLVGLCGQALQGAPPGGVCQMANYLFPTGRVVSGHLPLLERVREAALQAGALKATLLAVSGAFHTPLMAGARERLVKALAAVTIKPPRVAVLSNVTGRPFPSDPAAIADLLGRQLVEPVQWEESLRWLLADPATAPATAGGAGGSTSGGGGGCHQLLELGPGQQIKAMVKRLDLTVWRAMINVSP